MTINGADFDSLYHKLAYELIYRYDDVVRPRDMEINELRNVELVLLDSRSRILTLPERNIDMRYLIGELCFYLKGSNKLADINIYSTFWNKISDDGVHVNSAYGKRLFYDGNCKAQTQIDYVISELRRDKDSRKAVAVIYNGEHDSRISNDNPCTMYLDFFIRRDYLYLTTHMRSNDMWLGLPYDLPFFCLVQEIVYTYLKKHYPDLKLGIYRHIVDSMHLYKRNYDDIKKIADTHAIEYKAEKAAAPALVLRDIENWFSDLLWYERRLNNHEELYPEASFLTPFQLWAIYNLKH